MKVGGNQTGVDARRSAFAAISQRENDAVLTTPSTINYSNAATASYAPLALADVLENGGGAAVPAAPTYFDTSVTLKTVHGLDHTHPAVGAGYPVILANPGWGLFDVVLKHESSSCVAADRFTLGADFTLKPGYAAAFMYRAGRWVVLE